MTRYARLLIRDQARDILDADEVLVEITRETEHEYGIRLADIDAEPEMTLRMSAWAGPGLDSTMWHQEVTYIKDMARLMQRGDLVG